jgi:phosphoribosylanthranilate isomerase
MGVNHIGVLVGDGRFPREQSIATAAEIAKAILLPSKFSTLFLSADIPLIESWARGPLIAKRIAKSLVTPAYVTARILLDGELQRWRHMAKSQS